AVLGPCVLYRCCRERRLGSVRLPAAVLPAAGAAVLSSRHGAACCFGQLAVLSHGRRPKDRARRHFGRVLPLRPGKDHGRPEQSRNDGPYGCGGTAGGVRRADGAGCAALSGGRMMAPPDLSSWWRTRMGGWALMALFGLACLAGCLVATPSFAHLLVLPARATPIPG